MGIKWRPKDVLFYFLEFVLKKQSKSLDTPQAIKAARSGVGFSEVQHEQMPQEALDSPALN